MTKIFDLKKSEQTEELKARLYKLVRQFVLKYQRIYYPQYKGDLDDLIADYYISFLTEKSREKGKEASLLDKFDPNITTLEYLVKIAVQRKLIDGARTDKGEKNYTESYDEDTGDLSVDFLANKIDKEEPSVDQITFSEDDILELRDRYDELTEAERKHFLRMYKEVKNVLSPNFKALFEDLVTPKA